ncbi:AAA family ATPase [Brevibacterium casei]|uniref:Shikimate kinase n=2 Tax=Actinomycetes TaxID=1760 RepID=A0A2H1JBN8_9MICO|nr:AAA family ATPase [Brevibacterium casei]MDH5147912.1 AAA family ATPase [Brevibacterium casei]QPR38955.1 AAA family ATPase [Brevibacterium casei]QPR43121.1 AAA family ATPase [Brevibacterium casei]SMX84764.1 shikimate kinase [Brevibacterium casei CIP 102111]
MATAVILVNGIPASGKSTLGAELAEAAGVPFLSVDEVLERLVDSVDYRFPRGPVHELANTVTWRLAALVDDTVVVESFWARERDLETVRDGLRVAGAETVVEVWCDAPVDEAVERYENRDRHGIHEDDPNDVDLWRRSAPLALGPIVRVDTSSTSDAVSGPEVLAQVRDALGIPVA